MEGGKEGKLEKGGKKRVRNRGREEQKEGGQDPAPTCL